VLRGAIPVANDQYIIAFGESMVGAGNDVLGGTGIVKNVVPCAPAIIGPNQSLLVYTWGASMSNSPETEVEIGWWER
jgi:hypothetical protein